MKTGDQFQKMLRLQARVGDYELIQPSRELVKEGELMMTLNLKPHKDKMLREKLAEAS